MKKSLPALAAACLYSLMAASPVLATSYTIIDEYVGGNSDNPGNRAINEVIGDEQYWAISKMVVDISATALTVDIYSRFFDNIGRHNVYMGDLFISVDGWHPYGAAPYDTDIHANGEDWEYALSLDYDRYSQYGETSGTATFYAVDPAGTIVFPETQPADKRATWYRAGQEIYYTPYDQQPGLGHGTWEIYNLGGADTDDYLRFEFSPDLLAGSSDLAFRWQLTCANDVIEAPVNPVPEPATVLLLGTGLAGLAGRGLRSRPKR